ncbi:WhiB family transcriptional regulator [Brachybacterium alimentarium]|uniref:WhiB family transcriptional regulator n=1 Tax=Brachybacterium alimentarium TaxID=47845 RepID=UPI003FD3ABF2
MTSLLTTFFSPADTAAHMLPCHDTDAADLFFSERHADLEQAKSLCTGCPLLEECRQGALDREEPWGVWGGAIFDAGRIIAVKRGRGRPRKNPQQAPDQNPQEKPADAA